MGGAIAGYRHRRGERKITGMEGWWIDRVCVWREKCGGGG